MGNKQTHEIVIDYEKMSDKQIALLRKEQRKEKRYARPHEVSVTEEEIKNKKKRKRKRNKKKRKRKGESEEKLRKREKIP